jgi:hypothetical protein
MSAKLAIENTGKKLSGFARFCFLGRSFWFLRRSFLSLQFFVTSVARLPERF